MQTSVSTVHDLLRHSLDFCRQCVERGDLGAAHQALGRALALSPRNPELLSHRGRIALALRDFASANTDFLEALRLDRSCASALSGLAAQHLEQGNISEAEKRANQALALDAADEEALDVLTAVRNLRGTIKPVSTPSSSSKPLANPQPTASPAAQSLEILNQFHTNASDFFADVVPPPLTLQHLQNSRIVPTRDDILPLMPKGGVCAEVGTQTGGFAKLILSVLQPSKLHIYDIDYTPFDHGYFREAVEQGRVELHRGDSSTLLGAAPDRYFDFIYIDGDHSYEGVVKDLDQAAVKIKENGWIVCNDYTIYSPLEKTKYGVYRAVNEFCLKHGFEIALLGLHRWGYHDVALRRIGTVRNNGAASAHSLNAESRQAPMTREALPAVRELARQVGDDWKQHSYYDDAERWMEQQWHETIWPLIQKADFSCVLDLAAGHGRNSEKLRHHAKKIYVVDINQENIEFCQKRFAGDSRFVYFRNDGCSLEAIPANEISLAYCFDAMVHFDSDVVRAYLREMRRVLRPGAMGFFHHSNYSQKPGGDVHNNPGWRNFMTQGLFAHYCAKEGLSVIQSKVIDWDTPQSDCLTVFRKPA